MLDPSPQRCSSCSTRLSFVNLVGVWRLGKEKINGCCSLITTHSTVKPGQKKINRASCKMSSVYPFQKLKWKKWETCLITNRFSVVLLTNSSTTCDQSSCKDMLNELTQTWRRCLPFYLTAFYRSCCSSKGNIPLSSRGWITSKIK